MKLDEIKRIDITVVASILNIDVKKAGQNYSGLCPFHSEKTPSFVLFANNSWRCFGCNEGGSNVDLVMKKLGLEFSAAVDWLGTRLGDVDTIDEILLPSLGGAKTDFQHRSVDLTMIKYWHDSLYHSGQDTMFRARGFNGQTISKLGFGWDGERYIIPVWLDEPWISPCIGIRKRASEFLPKDAFKYIGKKGYNKPCMYNRHTAQNDRYMFVFAGELDSALCYQDGFPSVSLVNGMMAFSQYPKNWGYLWFPSVKKIYVVFDRKEAHIGGKVAASWESQKGRGTAHVIHWPSTLIDNVTVFGYDDYNDFRLESTHNNKRMFLDICLSQLPGDEKTWLLRSSNTKN